MNICSKLKKANGMSAIKVEWNICFPIKKSIIKEAIEQNAIIMFSLLKRSAERPIKYLPTGGTSGIIKIGFSPLINAPPENA